MPAGASTKKSELQNHDALLQVLGTEHGEHVGIYRPKTASVEKARENTTAKMLRLTPNLKRSSRVLILGSGFGGVARYLVDKYGSKVDCLNNDEEQNTFNQGEVDRLEIQKKLIITQGPFNEIPYDRQTFDMVWCQDILLHGSRDRKVFKGIHRVLKDSGRFIFSGSFQSEDYPEEKMRPLLDTLPGNALITADEYESIAGRAFLQKIYYSEMSEQLEHHYTAMLAQLEEKKKEVIAATSKSYFEETKAGYEAWVKATQEGFVDWGVMMFQKING